MARGAAASVQPSFLHELIASMAWMRRMSLLAAAGSGLQSRRNARVSQNSHLKQHRTSSKARTCDDVASPARETSFKHASL